MLIDFDHNVAEVEKPVREQGIYKRDVRVGNNVWIGLRRTDPARSDRRRQRDHRRRCGRDQGRAGQRRRGGRAGKADPDAGGTPHAALGRARSTRATSRPPPFGASLTHRCARSSPEQQDSLVAAWPTRWSRPAPTFAAWCATRARQRLFAGAAMRCHVGDVLDPGSLAGAGRDCEVAYYLVHSMGRGGRG